jgi:hypothetical protein
LIYHPHVHPPRMAKAGTEFAWIVSPELDSPTCAFSPAKAFAGARLHWGFG